MEDLTTPSFKKTFASDRINKTQKILRFIFPFYPLKLSRSVTFIYLLAALLAVSILLNNFFSIRVIAGINFSFSWIPTYIIGWYFGPIVGLVMGFTIDTVNWLIGGGYWFWMYAIQEPILGLIVGIISSIFIVMQKKRSYFVLIVIVNQFLLFFFFTFSLFMIFYFTDVNNYFFQNLINNSNNETSQVIAQTHKVIRWIILGLIVVFFTIIESWSLYKIYCYKKQQINLDKTAKILIIIGICVITTTIFSFILGPISAIGYFKFVFQKEPTALVKYGVIYYLLPRIIKECFKTPFYIVLLVSIIFATNPIIKMIKFKLQNMY